MPISEGIKLGRYEIRAHIGAGGMGQVYLAQDTSELDRAVAIKLLPAEVAADPKWMKRFIREARLGHFTQALTLAQSALKVERNRNVLTRAALAFALAGDIAKAQTLIEELEQKHPKDTMVNQVWLPEIKAVIELRKNNAQGALELLETTRRYEAAAGISPQTLRSMVYLKLGQGAQAVTESAQDFGASWSRFAFHVVAAGVSNACASFSNAGRYDSGARVVSEFLCALEGCRSGHSDLD